MPSIDIPAFEGEFPRINSQKLKNTQAQSSINADHSEGTLKSLKGLLTDTTLTGLSVTPQSLYLIRAGSGKKFWVVSPYNTTFTRAPSSNSEGVFCYADGSYPRKSNYALASNGSANTYGVPNTAYSLSVPEPATALTTSSTGTPGEYLGSFSYVYTWVNSWGHEGKPSPPSTVLDVYDNEYVTLDNFEDVWDSTWLVPQDIVGVRFYRLNSAEDGTSEFQAIDDLHTATGNKYGSFKYGAAQYGAPYTGYAEIGTWAKGSGTISVSGTAITGTDTLFTSELSDDDYIRAKGWIFKITERTSNILGVVESTYADLEDVEYQYCSSWLDSPGTINDKSGVDVLPDANLGVILQTEEHDEPERSMKGLTLMANNVFAGFNGNSLRLSEPGLMNAWPYDYEIITPENIVALGNFGTTLVAPTESYPYIIECYDPLNATKTIIQEKQRCIFARSLISGNGFVAYISPDGLIVISQAGLSNITQGSFTKAQWAELLTNASSYDKRVSAFLYDNKYHAFFEGTKEGFYIDLETGAYSEYTFDSDIFVHGFVDAIDDSLNLLIQNGGTYYIKKWRDGDDLTYDWTSKTFFFPVPISISCGKLFGEIVDSRLLDGDGLPLLDGDGEVILEAGDPRVLLSVYADGEQVGDSLIVFNNKPFRFQRKVANTWEFRFQGTSEIYSAIFSSTMDDIFLGGSDDS